MRTTKKTKDKINLAKTRREIKSAGFSMLNICMENTTNPPEAIVSAITVQDLVALKALVEAAAARGTFKAEEMTAVGTLYDKLANFLKSLEPTVTPPTESGVAEMQEPQGE